MLEIAENTFPSSDIVIIEGGKKVRNIRKIEVLRSGISETIETPKEELLAAVYDKNLDLDTQIFQPDQIEELADFIERKIKGGT